MGGGAGICKIHFGGVVQSHIFAINERYHTVTSVL